MEINHKNDHKSTDLEHDILVAVLRAFQLTEEANGSQKNFMDILNFGRDMSAERTLAIQILFIRTTI